MKTKTLAALAAFTTVMTAAGSASAFPGYTTDPVNMRAGPGVNYPVIIMVGDDEPVEINGCMPQYNWCDVQAGPYRGWVSGQFLQGIYDNRDEFITEYGEQIGVPIISFDVDDYWGRYYRNRPFYNQRERYANFHHDDYRRAAPHYGHGNDNHYDNRNLHTTAQHDWHHASPANAPHDNHQPDRTPDTHHDNDGDRHDGDSHGSDRGHH